MDPSPSVRRRSTSAGMSLLELLVAITIFGIISAVAIPNMVRYTKRTKVETAARQVLADFERARSTALRTNATVAVIKTGATTYTIQGIGSRSLDGATFDSAAVDTVRFAPIGPLSGHAVAWSMSSGPYSRTVHMSSGGRGSVE